MNEKRVNTEYEYELNISQVAYQAGAYPGFWSN